MITVYGRRSAFNVQKVLWLVGELGLAHSVIEKGGEFGGLDTPGFLALNPNGRVPVLKDGDTVVWESHAILRYLAAQYGAPGWWPADPSVRARVDQWMDWAPAYLQRDFLTGVFWGWYRTPAADRDGEAVAASLARVADQLRLLDHVLGDKAWLLGDEPGLADIVLGANLFRYHELDIARPDLPRIQAWYRRMTERPAYRDAVMLPFEYMKGRLAY